MKRIFAIVVFSILTTLSVYGQGNYKEYLCLTSMDDGNEISFDGGEIQYIKDGNDWQDFSGPITLNKNEKIYIRSYYGWIWDGKFSMTGQTHASGNIMSLMLEDDDSFRDDLGGYTFQGLFQNCETLTSIEGMKMTATKLIGSCYESMFANTGIESIPEGFLPATKLDWGCYESMFKDCRNLKTIPGNLLPATELEYYCYWFMFEGCNQLTEIPLSLLPATQLSSGCYEGMFLNCQNLKNTPKITINQYISGATSCKEMFLGCTNLEKIYLTLNITNVYESLYGPVYDYFIYDKEPLTDEYGDIIYDEYGNEERLYVSWVENAKDKGIFYCDQDGQNAQRYFVGNGWLTNAYTITDDDGLIKTQAKSIDDGNDYYESGNTIVTNIHKIEDNNEHIAVRPYYEYTGNNGKIQIPIVDINDEGYYTFVMPYYDIAINAQYYKDIDVPESKEMSPKEDVIIIRKDEINLDGNEIDMITINREEVKPAFDEEGNIIITDFDMTCPNTYLIGFELLYGETQKTITINRHWPVEIKSETPDVADGYCEGQTVNIDIDYNGDLQIEDIESLKIGDLTITDFKWEPKGDSKGSISFTMPEGIKEGENKYSIKFKKGTSITSDQTQISATSRVSSTEMMFLYDDVVFMNNRDGNSRKFQSYKWTIDGDSVGCKQYYQDPSHRNLREIGKEIMVEVVTINGEKLKSCPLDDKAGNIHSETLSKRARHQASVYPNPAQDGGIITIELENYTEAEIAESCIMIFNSLGSEVRRINHCQTINKTSLPKGIYTGYVARGNEQVSFKILVK